MSVQSCVSAGRYRGDCTACCKRQKKGERSLCFDSSAASVGPVTSSAGELSLLDDSLSRSSHPRQSKKLFIFDSDHFSDRFSSVHRGKTIWRAFSFFRGSTDVFLRMPENVGRGRKFSFARGLTPC